MWSQLTNLFRGYSRNSPEFEQLPTISIMKIVHIKCCVCAKNILDGELVVTASGIGHETAHAMCVLVIREENGTITGKRHPLNVSVTRNEWEELKKYDT